MNRGKNISYFIRFFFFFFQLAKKLAAICPGLSVLMSSGYADRKAHLPAIRKRGFHFLQKPAALNEILKAVKEALAKKGEA